jgi:hypothetical protein
MPSTGCLLQRCQGLQWQRSHVRQQQLNENNQEENFVRGLKKGTGLE